MTEGPYYIVKEGTNLCDRIGVGRDAHQPQMFDTEEIAQSFIDRIVEVRKLVGIAAMERRVPISVARYDEKYGTIMRSNDRQYHFDEFIRRYGAGRE